MHFHYVEYIAFSKCRHNILMLQVFPKYIPWVLILQNYALSLEQLLTRPSFSSGKYWLAFLKSHTATERSGNVLTCWTTSVHTAIPIHWKLSQAQAPTCIHHREVPYLFLKMRPTSLNGSRYVTNMWKVCFLVHQNEKSNVLLHICKAVKTQESWYSR